MAIYNQWRFIIMAIYNQIIVIIVMAMFGMVENQWQWKYNLYNRRCQSCHILMVIL
jgi:hypothetical protein